MRCPCCVDQTVIEHQGGAFLVLFRIKNHAAMPIVVIAGTRIGRNDINRPAKLLRPGC